MKTYLTIAKKLQGTEFKEVHKKAFRIYRQIAERTKRRPYVRSTYFNKENPNKTTEILHRFAGTTKENELFFVQIKEIKQTGQKFFISVFPHK